jgi:hypothetical protein
MITADREFHSIFLSHWLKKHQRPDVYFVLRKKKLTIIKQGKPIKPPKFKSRMSLPTKDLQRVDLKLVSIKST